VSIDGVNEAQGTTGPCDLLLQTVTIIEPPKFNSAWVLVGSVIGCIVFVCALIFWVRRNADALKDILYMVLTETGKFVVSTCFELGDLVTDIVSTYRVCFVPDLAVPLRYQIPYAVIGCLSAVQGVASLCFSVHILRELRSELKKTSSPDASGDDSSADDSLNSWRQKLAWEQDKVTRDYRSLAVKSLSLLLEDIPMVHSNTRTPLLVLLFLALWKMRGWAA